MSQIYSVCKGKEKCQVFINQSDAIRYKQHLEKRTGLENVLMKLSKQELVSLLMSQNIPMLEAILDEKLSDELKNGKSIFEICCHDV